jgi:hypothetical protein
VAYCLDSNTFIEAKNRYYGLDFCPAYWEWLDREASAGQLLCVRAIYDEIAEGKDDLATWIKARSDGDWLCKIDAEDTQKAFKQVVTYVESRRGIYTDEAIATFMGRGDPWLIAYCLGYGHTLVTHERSQPDAKRRVPIPDVCVALERRA